MERMTEPLRPDSDPALAPAEAPVPLQLATLRVGMRITLLAPLVAAATLVIARRGDVITGPFALVFVASAVSAAVVTLLPYDRFFRIGWGIAGLYAWSALNLMMIAVGVWATGGHDSPLVFLYALTTLFFAVAFSTRVQVVFFAMTVGSYVAFVGWAAWDPFHIGVLLVLALLANLLVGQLKRQMAAHRDARLESERRWALLAVVSAASRRMSAVEPLAVLGAIVDSVVALGFPVTRIYVQVAGGYRVILPAETARDFPGGIEAFPSEAVERALSEARTVVVGEAADLDVDERLAAIQLRSAVIVPVTTDERVDALLVVGAEGPAPAAQDVEVFQMLAQQGAVALENARRFEQQRHAMERLAELDRMKSDFLSSVSHELRTPLTVIAGMGRTLEDGWQQIGEDDRRDLLARLNANAAALDTLIGELLDFGRLDGGQLQIEPVPFDLHALACGVVDRLASLFRLHTVRIEIQEELSTFADPLLIERVIENLLTNAAKYTPAESRVTLAAETVGREVVVSVSDDGPGIPADELAHIGERFFRGGDPNTRSTRGTGLGLALASEVLGLHGTLLEVTSEVGSGSRFAFRLPRGSVEPEPQEALTAPQRSLIVTDGGLPGERFETVMAGARSGVEWAVAVLYREFHPRVVRYLKAQLPDRADDLAKETWDDIASSLPSFEGDEASFRRWVFAVARGHLVDARKRSDPHRLRRHTNGRIHRLAPRSSRPVEEALQWLGSLEPVQADVLLLRTVGGLDLLQVAEITGESADVVAHAEEEGLEQLRRWADYDPLERVGVER
jgi:RNA polymerase sigma factor (sigma-70 family)